MQNEKCENGKIGEGNAEGGCKDIWPTSPWPGLIGRGTHSKGKPWLYCQLIDFEWH